MLSHYLRHKKEKAEIDVFNALKEEYHIHMAVAFMFNYFHELHWSMNEEDKFIACLEGANSIATDIDADIASNVEQ